MVNNSTNINKTNYHLSLSVLTQKKTTQHKTLVCDRYSNVAGPNRLMGSQPTNHDNWISNENTNINKRKKTNSTDSLSLEKDHILSQKTTNNINMGCTIAGSMIARSYLTVIYEGRIFWSKTITLRIQIYINPCIDQYVSLF